MTAPMALDGPMAGEWSLPYIEQVPVPTLRQGDVVILDNLPAHKGTAVRGAVEAVGATLLSKAAARTVDQLWHVVGNSIDAFTPTECANDFAAAGYDAY